MNRDGQRSDRATAASRELLDDLPRARRLRRTAAELLTPDDHGAGFAKRYFDAIQSSPDVAVAHAEARRAITALLK